MLRRRPDKSNDVAVDLTPMIDMTFILLIFSMVSTTFVKDMKLDINRPGAQTQVVASTKAVRLYIDKQGETYMDASRYANGSSNRVCVINSRA